MSYGLFDNRKTAIGFVLVILVGTAAIVGTEDNKGILTQTAESLDKNGSPFKTTTPPEQNYSEATPQTPAASQAEYDSFFSDSNGDELDTAAGIDPTPTDDFSGQPSDPTPPPPTPLQSTQPPVQLSEPPSEPPSSSDGPAPVGAPLANIREEQG